MNARRQTGLGKLEFAVFLVLFGILSAFLLDRLIALEQETEQLEVDLTLRHIDIGLKLAIGERMMRGEDAKIPALLDANPLIFLGSPPKVGAGGTAGAWAYDRQRRLLSYWPRQPAAFSGATRLDWRFTGHTDEIGRMTGLRLEPLK